jgi:hypothetical protein
VPTIDALRDANELWPFALVGKLSRVMEHENKTIRGRYAPARRLEMARQNVRFVDPVIGEKPIRRLGVCPILANKRNALPDVAPDPLKQHAKSLAKPRVAKFAPGDLAINPRLSIKRGTTIAPARAITQHDSHRAPLRPNQVLNNESQQILLIQVSAAAARVKRGQKCG